MTAVFASLAAAFHGLAWLVGVWTLGTTALWLVADLIDRRALRRDVAAEWRRRAEVGVDGEGRA